MMDSYTVLTNVRVAGEPTFFPHPTDAKKHRCLVTVIKNRGKNKNTGVEMKDTYSLVFWGPYAQSAAMYIDKGRALNIHGVLRSNTKPTGQVKANGKEQLTTDTSINVLKFEFGPESKKELVKRLSTNLAIIKAAKDAGTRQPGLEDVTAEELIKVQRPQMYDYNPELAAQTGRYGNARVYIKDQGWINASAPAASPVANEEEDIAALQAKIDAIKAAGGPVAAKEAVAVAETVDPFPQS